MFEKGDKFIHYTKYGGVNIGEVRDVNYTQVYDTDNLVIYERPVLITTNSVVLELDGSDGRIFKVKDVITEKRAERLVTLVKTLKEKKENTKKRLEEKHNTQFKSIL